MASADKGTSRIPRAARSLDDAAHQGPVFKAGRKASSHAGASPEKWRGAMDSCRWLDNASGPETNGRRRSLFLNRVSTRAIGCKQPFPARLSLR